MTGPPTMVSDQGARPTVGFAVDAYAAVWTLPGEDTGWAGTVITREGQPLAGRAFTITGGDSKPVDPLLRFRSDGTGVLAYRREDRASGGVMRGRVRPISWRAAPSLADLDGGTNDLPVVATDSGQPEIAGTVDAHADSALREVMVALPDASEVGEGVTGAADAGAPGGTSADGANEGGHSPPSRGCQCQQAANPPGAGMLAVLLLALALRHRRSRRVRS